MKRPTQAVIFRAAMYGHDVAEFDRWLAALGHRRSKAYLQGVRRLIDTAPDPLLRFAVHHLQVCRYAIDRDAFVVPLARHGKAMKGRKHGSVDRLSALLDMLVRKDPKLTVDRLVEWMEEHVDQTIDGAEDVYISSVGFHGDVEWAVEGKPCRTITKETLRNKLSAARKRRSLTVNGKP